MQPTTIIPPKSRELAFARSLMPADQGRTFTVTETHANGLTQDIVQAVVDQFRRSWRDTARLAPHFQVRDKCNGCTAGVQLAHETTLRAVWAFARHQITYVLDHPPGTQWIKTPRTVIMTGFADCKGLSTLVNSLLANLGYKPYFKFVAYVPGGLVTHVYTFVEAGGKRYVLDACMHDFNIEKNYSGEQLVPALA